MADSIYQTFKPAGGGDNLYLKLADGESVKLRIASEPAIFTTTFADSDPTTRFAWTVWNRNENQAQVFAGGKSIYNQIAELVEEWGEPTTFDMTIKRTGTMLETRYSVNPAPKSVDLTPEQEKECNSVDLLKAVKGHWLKDFDKAKEDSGADEVAMEEINLNDIFPED